MKKKRKKKDRKKNPLAFAPEVAKAVKRIREEGFTDEFGRWHPPIVVKGDPQRLHPEHIVNNTHKREKYGRALRDVISTTDLELDPEFDPGDLLGP